MSEGVNSPEQQNQPQVEQTKPPVKERIGAYLNTLNHNTLIATDGLLTALNVATVALVEQAGAGGAGLLMGQALEMNILLWWGPGLAKAIDHFKKPELRGKPYKEQLKEAWKTGKPLGI